MLFNSFEFIFGFLPIVLIVYFATQKLPLGKRHVATAALLVISSLFFYGWWNPDNLPILFLSILINFAIGNAVATFPVTMKRRRAALTALAVGLNLGALAYYKYTGFIIENASALLGKEFETQSPTLPLAISFFTFIQIAYLVDIRRGKSPHYGFFEYLLFVVFFPHLIAGPLVHHDHLIEQFRSKFFRISWESLARGSAAFVIGLAKKVIIADQFAVLANAVFTPASKGDPLYFIDAWVGALSYTFQLYFDFSGYSDMAIGLALLFNIRMPINFDSPYKAANIIDFWRRWHITLSNFLRDYLYIPLGGNRKGAFRRYLNLFLTMLLGGLWHGANWTFVLWGALHGTYLAINHFWRGSTLGKRLALSPARPYRMASYFLTFLAVVVAWVPFRAPDFKSTLYLYGAMIGVNGVSISQKYKDLLQGPDWLHFHGTIQYKLGLAHENAGLWLIFGFLGCLLLPNTMNWVGYRLDPETKERSLIRFSVLNWKPNFYWSFVLSSLFLYTLWTLTAGVSQFLYFEF